METELKTIFGTGVTVGSVLIPAAHLHYYGSEKKYVTWEIIDETPDIVAEDEDDVYFSCSVDVTICAIGGYKDIKNAVMHLMHENGWLWSETSPEMYDTETKMYSRVITFTKEGYTDNA